MRGAIERSLRVGLAAVSAALLLAGCMSPVAGHLDEAQADKVALALDQAGIAAQREASEGNDGTFEVTVARADATRALAVLASEELPRPSPPTMLDALGKGQLVPSADAERASYAAGLSGELERSLETVDGVLRARVHLSLPDPDPLRDAPPAKATASVLLSLRAGAAPIQAEDVQKLVAAAAPSLAPADVVVVMVARPALPAEGSAALAHVGPIAVAPSSEHLLVTVLATLLALVGGMTAAMLAFYMRSMRLRKSSRPRR
ncbi:MAG TPA: hypothetical protein VF407_00420 [Polyangiaceae bacterium]